MVILPLRLANIGHVKCISSAVVHTTGTLEASSFFSLFFKDTSVVFVLALDLGKKERKKERKNSKKKTVLILG